MADNNTSPPVDTPEQSTSTPKPKQFKVRGGIQRKSKAERDQYAKQEAERAAARAAAAEKLRASTASKPKEKEKKDQNKGKDVAPRASTSVFANVPTSTRSSTKSRLMGMASAERLDGPEGLPLTEGPVLKSVEGEGTNGDASVSTKVGGRGSGTAARGGAKDKGNEMFDLDDEIDAGPTTDIDTICLSDTEDQEDINGSPNFKGKMRAISESKKQIQSSLTYRPVRARRLPAVEQDDTRVSATSPRTSRSNRAGADDADILEEVVDDMQVDEEVIAEDGVPIKRDPPSSPEMRRRLNKRASTRLRDAKLANETVEEKSERLRLRADMMKMKNEFTVPPKPEDSEDVTMDDAIDSQHEKLFLFQFPPLVPYLVDQSSLPVEAHAHQTSGPHIKKDPDAPVTVSEPADAENANTTSTPKTKIQGIYHAAEPLKLPSGRVGKLRVHKSGKVTLDWGGTDMEVRYGTEVDFLQDAVLVETPKTTAEDGSDKTTSQMGTAFALGQVQKKMIVIPDWQKLYD